MWVQNGPIGFAKIQHTKRTTYSLHNNNFVSGGLQRNKKISKTVTQYHRELLKKKSSLSIYNTQPVIKELKTAIM
jgi:hypothetical protein